MTKLQQLIMIVNSFSAGILLPVLNLVLLERGSNLQTLPLLLAVYSITVLCFEFPSGVLADLYGRKAMYLLSLVFQLISFFFLSKANNIIWLIISIIFFGLGRAFSSGSLDALIIDQALVRYGEGCLVKVTSRLFVLEGIGLAAGSITGGLTANITGTYSSNIILRIVLASILFILCFYLIKEYRPAGKKQSDPAVQIDQRGKAIQPGKRLEINQSVQTNKRKNLSELIYQGKQVIFNTPKLGLIFFGVFFTGFLLCTVETYWQPAFMRITAEKTNTWALGVITFIGFIAVTAGNSVSRKLLERSGANWWKIYIYNRIFLAVLAVIFAVQSRAPGFVALYTFIYLLLGAGNVAESTLINKYTPNHLRASTISLNSFISQIGGLVASLFSSAMILRLQFFGIWITAGGLLGIFSFAAAVINKKRKEEQRSSSTLTSSGV